MEKKTPHLSRVPKAQVCGPTFSPSNGPLCVGGTWGSGLSRAEVIDKFSTFPSKKKVLYLKQK